MIEVESKQGLHAELAKTKKLLVLFYASWCGFCTRFVPVFDHATATFNTLHVLLDDYDNQLWDDYGVGAVPTVIYFEDGRVRKRLDARLGRGLNEQQFAEWLSELES